MRGLVGTVPLGGAAMMVLLPLLAGCSVGLPPQESPLGLDLALWAPPGAVADPLDEWDGSEGYTFSGVVDGIAERGGVSDMTLGWGDGTYTVLTLLDAQDAEWEVGVSLDKGVGEVPLELDVAPGDTLDVQFIHGVGFADDHGIVVRDATGLVLVGEEGWHTDFDQMDPDPSGDLDVFVGDSDGPRGRTGCGNVRGQSIEVHADTTVVVPFDGEAEVSVGGVLATAHNLGAYSYMGQVECTDTWGPWSWAIVR